VSEKESQGANPWVLCMNSSFCISSLRKNYRYTPEGVMRYKGGNAAFDDIHAARDDMPLLSQWIKKRQVETCRFLVEEGYIH